MRWLSDDAVARLRDAAEQPDLSGTRYDLVRELGRGGMGIVYEVFDRELARAVAMKVVEHEWSAEARVIAALEHPGIVPVHDLGTLPDGRLYTTMKLVRGVRLDEWTEGRALTEKLRLFARVCEPVAFAHANGVVHRDLKPENVMVGEFGAVLVMDWGVARTSAEQDGVVVGTPGYIAPEVLGGASADPRADVFALGAVLSFLLRGEQVPRPLAAIVTRATAANREERYGDASTLADDVLRILDHQPVSAYRESVLERAGRFVSKHRALLAIVAAYLVMRVAVYFWIRL
jgi:serine/threonine protein kinase